MMGNAFTTLTLKDSLDYFLVAIIAIHLSLTISILIALHRGKRWIHNDRIRRYLSIVLAIITVQIILMLYKMFFFISPVLDYLGALIANFGLLFIFISQIEILKKFAVLSAFLSSSSLAWAERGSFGLFFLLKCYYYFKPFFLGPPKR